MLFLRLTRIYVFSRFWCDFLILPKLKILEEIGFISFRFNRFVLLVILFRHYISYDTECLRNWVLEAFKKTCQ